MGKTWILAALLAVTTVAVGPRVLRSPRTRPSAPRTARRSRWQRFIPVSPRSAPISRRIRRGTWVTIPPTAKDSKARLRMPLRGIWVTSARRFGGSAFRPTGRWSPARRCSTSTCLSSRSRISVGRSISLDKGSSLTRCVSSVVDAVRGDGTLSRLEHDWLADAGKAARPRLAGRPGSQRRAGLHGLVPRLRGHPRRRTCGWARRCGHTVFTQALRQRTVAGRRHRGGGLLRGRARRTPGQDPRRDDARGQPCPMRTSRRTSTTARTDAAPGRRRRRRVPRRRPGRRPRRCRTAAWRRRRASRTCCARAHR